MLAEFFSLSGFSFIPFPAWRELDWPLASFSERFLSSVAAFFNDALTFFGTLDGVVTWIADHIIGPLSPGECVREPTNQLCLRILPL